MLVADIIKKTDDFVKESFQKNPHYSFNHWSVMYDHSVKVKDLALEVARGQNCDELVLAVSAFLHDIGKTYKADMLTLHQTHEKLNVVMAKDFLESLKITEEQRKNILNNISGDNDSIESRVVQDADGLAFYLDRRLYMLWIEWMMKNGIPDSDRKKKIEKYYHFNFPISQEIGKTGWEQMKKDWEEYLKK